MNKKIKINSASTRTIQGFLYQYGLTIFTVIVAAGLIAAVSLLSAITLQPYLDTSGAQPTTSDDTAITIDQALTDKINAQKSSAVNSTNQTLPDGRGDPFSE